MLKQRLERYFECKQLGTDWRPKSAGITTFMTMAYIVFMNPAILHETGMPLAAVTAAACISAAIGSLLMGAFARYPTALAPRLRVHLARCRRFAEVPCDRCLTGTSGTVRE
jgi:adenine/guanine/hypoxanthine permease